MKKFLWAAFALYLATLLWLLFARASLDNGAPYWQQMEANLNLKPMVTLRQQWRLLNMDKAWAVRSGVINLYGNVLVFVPLGLGLPWLLQPLRRYGKTLFLCALAIIAVELTQLLTLRGFADVDDLFLNLVGVSLGYGLYWLLRGRKGKKAKAS